MENWVFHFVRLRKAPFLKNFQNIEIKLCSNVLRNSWYVMKRNVSLKFLHSDLRNCLFEKHLIRKSHVLCRKFDNMFENLRVLQILCFTTVLCLYIVKKGKYILNRFRNRRFDMTGIHFWSLSKFGLNLKKKV